MTTTDKFLSDIQRIIRYDRASDGGRYNARRACARIAELFAKNNRHLGRLANSIGDYWLNAYILGSQDMADEPSQENIARIKAFQLFVDNDDGEDLDILSADDWETLRDFVDDEAENLDLDALQGMMDMILSHGAL